MSRETPNPVGLVPVVSFFAATLIALVVVFVLPIFRNKGRFVTSRPPMSNAKQLGTAALMYAGDFDDRLPFYEPFEFGADPLEPYARPKDMHRNPAHHSSISGHRAGASDFVFQYIVEEAANSQTGFERTVYDLTANANFAQAILVWSPVPKAGLIQVSRADSSAKIVKPPYRNILMIRTFGWAGIRGRLLGPEEDWPPRTWSVPVRNVLAYAEQARMESLIKSRKSRSVR